MHYFRAADSRGKANFGWLNSYHSFSFGNYYDPQHMGFSVLRVINDDRVSAGAGFATHNHQNMEIISYVTAGALKHNDSMGNEFVVNAGEIQRLSAGTGITHSEYNASADAEVKFLQIWIEPMRRGIAPSYEQKLIAQTATLTPLLTPSGVNGSLSINQEVRISRLQLQPHQSYALASDQCRGYLHLVHGSGSANQQSIIAGDGMGILPRQQLSISADVEPLEALWFELPAEHNQ